MDSILYAFESPIIFVILGHIIYPGIVYNLSYKFYEIKFLLPKQGGLFHLYFSNNNLDLGIIRLKWISFFLNYA